MSIGNRAKESSVTTGTQTLTLLGTVDGFQTFVKALGDFHGTASPWEDVPYVIVHSNSVGLNVEWEMGRGTVTDGTPTTLTRGSIVMSSNQDALVDLQGGTKSVHLSPAAADFNSPTLINYGEQVKSHGNTGGGTEDFDLENGNIHSATVTASANTFTFSNPKVSGLASTLVLVLTNGGSQTVTWPSGVKWPSDIAPGLTASGVDIVTFFTFDNGTIWYGFISGIGLS